MGSHSEGGPSGDPLPSMRANFASHAVAPGNISSEAHKPLQTSDNQRLTLVHFSDQREHFLRGTGSV